MVKDWNHELYLAQGKLNEVVRMLEELAEQESTRLLRVKPVVSILTIGCDFITANLEIIRKQLARPIEGG